MMTTFDPVHDYDRHMGINAQLAELEDRCTALEEKCKDLDGWCQQLQDQLLFHLTGQLGIYEMSRSDE